MTPWISIPSDQLIEKVVEHNLLNQEILFKIKYSHKENEEHLVGSFRQGANCIIVVVGCQIFFKKDYDKIISFVPLNVVIS